MANLPSPPQMEEEYDVYKMRQFVEDMTRTVEQLNQEIQNAGSGGGGAGSGGYPAQLGYFGIR